MIPYVCKEIANRSPLILNTMGLFKEFKEFAVKGNVMDMAIGVVIGGAFGKIVTSLVSDIIMPLISAATGGMTFTNWKWGIRFTQIVCGLLYAIPVVWLPHIAQRSCQL